MAQKDGGGGGGRTNFSSMSHEEMLEWLDQASSFQVQAASDRLAAASFELGEIAQQLKFRPERVEWKGEGQQAFIDWGASLASATQRLADYSDEASRWMSRASNAIAEAQSSIPRYTTKEQAQANLNAAASAPNDPDSRTIGPKAQAELAAFAEAKEKNRLEAAETMSRLGKNFEESSAQMRGLEVPTFQPPPKRFVPDDRGVDSGLNEQRSGGAGGAAGPAAAGSVAYASRGEVDSAPTSSAEKSAHSVSSLRPEQPASMEIDSVATLPPATAPVSGPADTRIPGGRPDSGLTLPPVVLPPALGGTSPVSGARPVGGMGPTLPGQGSSGTGSAGRMPRDGGIVGGRPVPPGSGKAMGGIPRGTVIGAEGTHGRMPMSGQGAGGVGGTSAGQSGLAGGRRLAGETGGIVGGRPAQPGRTSARPFTPGGSGLVRSTPHGEAGHGAGMAGRGAGTSRGQEPRRDAQGERPDYLTEDEETWQQTSRRVVPPVVD
ncbi:WXG100 family type VII secretion target [Streptomyces sp. FIT100]|uniref:WXG100 family type VII secretion target n=1 Tax=Streptomyces sp. FIT100 TaxID=2837956 RepID=UPI0021CAB634|nr:immunity 70 family protein [Streptomyces sp. FIT100]UUN27156.1 hypothetical protein KK483_12655 [Streptomyces sp. FIT100]